jgi:Ni/Co efflux regulator RcnB
MNRSIVVAAMIAASVATPLASAQAGFFTDVAKGAVQNSARHAKKTLKDAADLSRLVGRCAINRATGRQC